MKRATVLTAALVLACGSMAMASGLNIQIVAPDFAGASDVTVGTTCGTLNYEVIVDLDDANNQGLALVGFDLEFSGGALDPATPGANMGPFVKPEGLTNPAGFGGTDDGGVLLQVGGGQNTIMNGQVPCTSNADCPAGSTCGGTAAGLCDPVAPFPVGTVVTGLAKGGSLVVATGTLTLPVVEGPYTLTASSLFANVITADTTGIPFWATAAATPGTNAPLNITVQEGADCSLETNSICDSVPPSGAIDARQPHEVNSATPAQGLNSIEVVMCNASVTADTGAFSLTEVGGDGVPPNISGATVIASDTVRLDFDAPIEPGAWTVVTHNASGTSTCVGFGPADANQDGISNASDINALINSINNVPGFGLPSYATDINRTEVTNPQDISRLIDLLNGAGTYTEYLGATLPPNPCLP